MNYWGQNCVGCDPPPDMRSFWTVQNISFFHGRLFNNGAPRGSNVPGALRIVEDTSPRVAHERVVLSSAGRAPLAGRTHIFSEQSEWTPLG